MLFRLLWKQCRLIVSYLDKHFDVMKLAYRLTNMANKCLHDSLEKNLYPFTEGKKKFLRKIRESFADGPFIVFTREGDADETFVRQPSNLCKSIVEIIKSQLYTYSMCQPTPPCLLTRWDLNSKTSRF